MSHRLTGSIHIRYNSSNTVFPLIDMSPGIFCPEHSSAFFMTEGFQGLSSFLARAAWRVERDGARYSHQRSVQPRAHATFPEQRATAVGGEEGRI